MPSDDTGPEDPMATAEIDIEEPESSGVGDWLARLVVFGLLAAIVGVLAYVVVQVDFSATVNVSADVSLSGPLTVLTWALSVFVVLVVLGSYARVFGVGFLNSIGSAVLDILDKYERDR